MTNRISDALLAVIAISVATTVPLQAAEKYSSGTKDWNTTDTTWGTTSGSYSGSQWDNAAPDSAFFEGTAGTVSLTEPISIQNLNISVSNYVISGNTLSFAGGGAITNSGIDVSITSAVTGSPSIRGNQASNKKFTFAPASGTVTLGAASGANDGELVLSGSTSGNSISSSTKLKFRKTGVGAWTLTGLASAYEHFIDSGDLIVSGSGQLKCDRALKISGGTLHYNTPAAVYDTGDTMPGSDTPGAITFSGGSLDNTSGSPVTSTTSPEVYMSKSWSFLGSLGASSDLNLGTGYVMLGANSLTVTVANAAATLTLGGPIVDGGLARGFVKGGAGTLALTGTSTYTGETTVNAGTLSISQKYLSDIAAVRMAEGATLNLAFTGTDDVFAVYTNGVEGPLGTWGRIGSGADNETALITGDGLLNVPVPTALEGIRYWDGGASDIGANGNSLSAGGSGTWNTTLKNWDCGAGVAHTNWDSVAEDDLAFFKGTAGVVSLGENITLGALRIETTGYTITNHTLNFGDGGTITNLGENVKIATGITGSPSVASSQGSNKELMFAPSSSDVALGAIVGDDSIVRFAGSGNGTVQSINTKTKWSGTGTWTVSGLIRDYQHWIYSGTLIVNGELMADNQYVALSGGTVVINGTTTGNGFTMTGGTIKGTGVINVNYASTIPAAGTIAPGYPTGTLTITNKPCTINGNLDVTIDGALHSMLAVDGALTITSATLNVTVLSTTGASVIIATYDSLVGTAFASVNGLPDGWTIDYNYQAGNAIALMPPQAGTVFLFE